MTAKRPPHPAARSAIWRWAILFVLLGLPAIAGVGYAGFVFLPGSVAQRIGLTAVGAALVGMFAAILAAELALRLTPKRQTVLYLQKCPFEPAEPLVLSPLPKRGTTRFRLAGMMDYFGLFGLRVVALRDERAPGALRSTFHLMPAIALAMVRSWPVFALVGWIAGGLALIGGLLRLPDVYSVAFLLGSILLAFLVLMFSRGTRQVVEQAFAEQAKKARGIIQPGHNARTPDDVRGIIARSRAIGTVTLRAPDADWQALVAEAIDRSDAILFDIRGSTENCEHELAFIASGGREAKVIWLTGAADEASLIVRQPDGYTIRGVPFRGAPSVYHLPIEQQSGIVGSDRDRFRRVSDILYVLDAVAPLARPR